VLRALPRTAASVKVPLRESATVASRRSGQLLRRRPGGGTELRELRELVPGDAFKMIAWKASAKAGKLMVREMESEVQQTVYVVLDISGSMRGGTPGDRKLDYGIELAAALLRSALERGDQAGVITADGRVVGHAPAREGLVHMATLDEVLLAATEVIDADLTEPDDDEVTALVARYVRHQDGVDFRAGTGFDLDGLARHVQTTLASEHELRLLAKVSGQPEPQHDPRVLALRRFCRARGIELRYRPESHGLGKAQGLAHALRTAAGGSRVPRTILVVTDFDGVSDPALLESTLRMLRTRQHAVSFLVPDAPSLLPRPDSRLVADLQLVYGLSETRRIADMRSFLYKLGVPLAVSSRRPGVRAAWAGTGKPGLGPAKDAS
jgi:hypothetical protein